MLGIEAQTQHSTSKWLCYYTLQEHRKCCLERLQLSSTFVWCEKQILTTRSESVSVNTTDWSYGFIPQLHPDSSLLTLLMSNLYFFSLEAPKLTHSLSLFFPLLLSWILVCTYQVFIRIIG